MAHRVGRDGPGGQSSNGSRDGLVAPEPAPSEDLDNSGRDVAADGDVNQHAANGTQSGDGVRKPRKGAGSSLERLAVAARKNDFAYGSSRDTAADRFPELWTWLTATKGHKGVRREPSNLRIKAVPNGWQITLADYNLSYQVSVGAANLEDLYPRLEETLASPTCPWEPIRWGKGEERRREEDRKLLDKLDKEVDT